jgi:chorismate dehydratase
MKESKLKVSIVSYLNSKPFAFGLENSDIYGKLEISFDPPAFCAAKLISKSADIGLVPVAVLPEIPDVKIISDYCISANGRVDSVLLLSNVPVNNLKRIILDKNSRTSVMLARVLASELWNINPEWVGENDVEGLNINHETGAVVIGDRALEIKSKFKFIYDLAEEWDKLTSLPFVFACWVSNKPINQIILDEFNVALKSGIENIDQLIRMNKLDENSSAYLKNIIDYRLDDEKRKSISLFLEKIQKVKVNF